MGKNILISQTEIQALIFKASLETFWANFKYQIFVILRVSRIQQRRPLKFCTEVQGICLMMIATAKIPNRFWIRRWHCEMILRTSKKCLKENGWKRSWWQSIEKIISSNETAFFFHVQKLVCYQKTFEFPRTIKVWYLTYLLAKCQTVGK